MQPFTQCESKDRVHGKLLRELKLKSFNQVELNHCDIATICGGARDRRGRGVEKGDGRKVQRVCRKGKRAFREGVKSKCSSKIGKHWDYGQTSSQLTHAYELIFLDRLLNFWHSVHQHRA